MVSLSPGFNTNSGGARYFSDDEERQFLEPILSSEQTKNFVPLKTIPAFSLQLVISTCISITGIVLAIKWTEERRCEAYFIMLYMQAALWLLSFIIDHVVHYHHNALRMSGYLEFHRRTNMLHRLPIYVVSLWNAVLLCVQALMQHYYSKEFEEHCIASILSPQGYIGIFLLFETLLLGGINGRYIYHVYKFNNARPPPDALKDEWRGGLPGLPSGQEGSVGYTQRGGHLADLLEKQADLIHYLQDHNTKLSQKLMVMNAHMRGSHSNL